VKADRRRPAPRVPDEQLRLAKWTTADLRDNGQKAAAARRRRADSLRAVRAGELRLAEVLRERPRWARNLLLLVLVMEQPYFGPAKVRQLNRRAVRDGINLGQILGHASDGTLHWLCRALEEQGR
jgi:hypothetical protein